MTLPTTMNAAEKRALLEKLLLQQASTPVDHPLSVYQRPLWLFELFEPGTSIYNNSMVLRFQGPIHVELLEQSARDVVRRHDPLRTAFVRQGEDVVQRVFPRVEFEMPVIDLRDVPADRRADEARRVALDEIKRAFDFATPPLARFTLLQLADQELVLIVAAHQIVCDGWSTGLLLKELTTRYSELVEGQQGTALAPLPVKYGDIAAAQRTGPVARAIADDLTYWGERLAGAPPVSEWPTDRPRPARFSARGGFAQRMISPELTARVRDVSRTHGATPFMFLLTALKALLFRHTGQGDLVLGVPTSGRNDPQTAPLIGCFVNSLPVRSAVSGGVTFEMLLARVRQSAIEAYAHEAADFGSVVERVGVARDTTHSPLFQVFFNMLNLPVQQFTVPGATVEYLPIIENDAKFDVAFYVSHYEGGLGLDVVYNADLYHAQTIDTMLRRYERAIEAAVREPAIRIADLPIEPEPPAACVSPIAPGPRFTPVPAEAIERSIVARFAEQAARRGGHPAVVGTSGTWTYAELNARADAVAARVQTTLRRKAGGSAKGGPGQVGASAPAAGMVALLCDNDSPMLAAMLGVLKAGQAYVPLDPLSPVERLGFVLRDAGATVIVADRANRPLAGRLVPQDAVIEVETCEAADTTATTDTAADQGPDALAYLLYTSGSTGQPKGVMQSHRNVLHFSRVYVNNLRVTEDDRLSLMASYCFDAAVMDIYAALLTGATLVVADVRQRGLADLAAWIRAQRITIYHSTPTVFRQGFPPDTNPATLSSVRAVVMGGEPVQGSDLDRFRALFPAHAWFVNGLGPTEATVALQAFYPASPDAAGADAHAAERHTIPVGLPVDGVQVQLLDAEGLPSDLHGELVIRSPHVALGYWHQPELTAHAFGGEQVRTFRTGDLLRRLPAGGFEFLGRRDGQVKIRGFRIELGEIEAALAAHRSIRQAAVLAATDADDDLMLTAFVEPQTGLTAEARELRRWLKARLPDYMLPSAIHILPALPMTASGKISRGALAAIDPGSLAPQTTVDAAPPQTATEQALAGMWIDVLHVRTVARDDDFFALGGHSLRATQLVSRVAGTFGVTMPLRTIFDASTLSELAAAIDLLVLDRAAATGSMVPDGPREEIEI